jgi:hypothetical protein
MSLSCAASSFVRTNFFFPTLSVSLSSPISIVLSPAYVEDLAATASLTNAVLVVFALNTQTWVVFVSMAKKQPFAGMRLPWPATVLFAVSPKSNRTLLDASRYTHLGPVEFVIPPRLTRVHLFVDKRNRCDTNSTIVCALTGNENVS